MWETQGFASAPINIILIKKKKKKSIVRMDEVN